MCGHGQFLPAYPTLEPQLAQGWNLKAHARTHPSPAIPILLSRGPVFTTGVCQCGPWEDARAAPISYALASWGIVLLCSAVWSSDLLLEVPDLLVPWECPLAWLVASLPSESPLSKLFFALLSQLAECVPCQPRQLFFYLPPSYPFQPQGILKAFRMRTACPIPGLT